MNIINVLVIELGIRDVQILKKSIILENCRIFFASSFLDIIDLIYKESIHCIIFSDFRGKEATTGYIKMFKTTNPQIRLIVLTEEKDFYETRSFYIQKGADFVSYWDDVNFINNILNRVWEEINNLEEFNIKWRELTNKFLRFIRFNYSSNNIIKEFARETGYSYTTIIHYVKKDTSKKCNDLINEVRIKNAVNLIKNGYPLKHIGLNVGFTSVQGFIKVFKKIIGETPSKFRKKYFNK
ncbi:MAG TPA: AraC family transcriptional regulator [Spirochaetota bacterium]|nr:AraC family transcriptional regulator [Spirochaetota bacterium]HOL56595.1 AraC family transcriptional regulator [Spirochaetota bacterium]HPP04018.1 AraC family transcriptional regulator [Spirochaetota bacterium]